MIYNHAPRISPCPIIPSLQLPDSPLPQTKQTIPPPFAKLDHAPPARLPIVGGAVTSRDTVADQILASRGGHKFWFGAEAANDGDFGDLGSGGGGEGSVERVRKEADGAEEEGGHV